MIELFKNLKDKKLIIVLTIAMFFAQISFEIYLPKLMAQIVDKGIINNDVEYIKKTIVLMISFAFMAAVLGVIGSYFAAKISMGFGKKVRSNLFQKIQSFSLREFDEIGTASLITRTTNDVTQVQNVLFTILRLFVRVPLMALGGIFLAVSTDAKLSSIIIVVIILLGLIIYFVGGKSMRLFEIMQTKVDNLNLVVRERLNGVRVIRAFNKVDYENKKFKKANEELFDNAVKVNKLIAVLIPLMVLIMNLTAIALMWFGAIRVSGGGMQVGELMAFIQYIMMIMFALMMMTMLFLMLPRAQTSSRRINEVMNLDLNDRPDLGREEGGASCGSLEFKNVSFSYPNAEEKVLDNISFCSNPGEVTAIIGGTGSGKSTLINLIPRFYDTLDGQVVIDGINVKDYNQKKLREKIGLVPQKSILFSGSIRENIRFGNEEVTDHDIENAIRVSQSREFIEKLPEGLDFSLAQGGTNISGGQKQRISIARALAKRPEIYIFDDSFSALDYKTDSMLRENLRKEIQEATVIMVAQRVATIVEADQIIVLDEGKLVAKGKHKELLGKCAIYREIVRSQLSEEEIDRLKI